MSTAINSFSQRSHVQIDESLLRGRKKATKNGKGRPQLGDEYPPRSENYGDVVEALWIFGLVEVVDMKVTEVRYRYVESRDEETLVTIILENVVQGATIMSDCWAAYFNLHRYGYYHVKINHSKEFVDLNGMNSNAMESMWRLLKLRLIKMGQLKREKIEKENETNPAYPIMRGLLAEQEWRFSIHRQCTYYAFLDIVRNEYCKPWSEVKEYPQSADRFKIVQEFFSKSLKVNVNMPNEFEFGRIMSSGILLGRLACVYNKREMSICENDYCEYTVKRRLHEFLAFVQKLETVGELPTVKNVMLNQDPSAFVDMLYRLTLSIERKRVAKTTGNIFRSKAKVKDIRNEDNNMRMVRDGFQNQEHPTLTSFAPKRCRLENSKPSQKEIDMNLETSQAIDSLLMSMRKYNVEEKVSINDYKTDEITISKSTCVKKQNRQEYGSSSNYHRTFDNLSSFANFLPKRCLDNNPFSAQSERTTEKQKIRHGQKRCTYEVKISRYVVDTTMDNMEEQMILDLTDLNEIYIKHNSNLRQISGTLFKENRKLQKIVITDAPKLKWITDNLLDLQNLHQLKTLVIERTHLGQVPKIIAGKGIKHNFASLSIYMRENRFTAIPSGSFERCLLSTLDLSHNQYLTVVDNYTFTEATINRLNLKDNPNLQMIEECAFCNMTMIRTLDISSTALENLPTQGLTTLKSLYFKEVPTVKKVPDISNFPHLRKALVTYKFHCCSFEKQRQEKLRRCTAARIKVPLETGDNTKARLKRDVNPFDAVWAESDDDFFERVYQEYNVDDGDNAGVATTTGAGTTAAQYKGPVIAAPETQAVHSRFLWLDEVVPVNLVGSVVPIDCEGYTVEVSTLDCKPSADALNPCEDVAGFTFLRIALWVVWISAMVGNVAVILVLSSVRHPRMRVHYFFMMNLAFADLCIATYLALLANEDLQTAGEYYNYAVNWQTGTGCNIAGFLAVFGTQLSILAMFFISFEIWYNTRFVFYMKRMSLQTGCLIMLGCWIVSIMFAIMPLIGVSSYSGTSTCLPLVIETLGDQIFIMIGLLLNLGAFIGITMCYYSIYQMINGSFVVSSDAALAKRMLLLIATDLLCMGPTILFGMTAALGTPLISITITKVFLVLFFPINSLVNPFLYVLSTKMIQTDLRNIMRHFVLPLCYKNSKVKDRSKAGEVRQDEWQDKNDYYFYNNKPSNEQHNDPNAAIIGGGGSKQSQEVDLTQQHQQYTEQAAHAIQRDNTVSRHTESTQMTSASSPRSSLEGKQPLMDHREQEGYSQSQSHSHTDKDHDGYTDDNCDRPPRRRWESARLPNTNADCGSTGDSSTTNVGQQTEGGWSVIRRCSQPRVKVAFLPQMSDISENDQTTMHANQEDSKYPCLEQLVLAYKDSRNDSGQSDTPQGNNGAQ